MSEVIFRDMNKNSQAMWTDAYTGGPNKWLFAKRDGSLDDQNQGDEGAGIVANDHSEDLASFVPLQMVIRKEDCPPNDQSQRDK